MTPSIKYLWIAPALLLLLLTRCKKPDPYTAPNNNNNSDTTFPDKGLVANFNFKTGTYWIYRDSVSGRMDSFYVSNNTTQAWQSLHSTGPGTAYFEYLIVYTINISSRNIDSPQLAASSTLSMSLLNNYSTLTYLINGNMSAYNPFFMYPTSSSIPSSDSTETNAVISSYASYSVSGNLYNNVTEIAHDSTGTSDRFFVSDGTGIVKMRINHPAQSIHFVWELYRSHILL